MGYDRTFAFVNLLGSSGIPGCYEDGDQGPE
jgi:hypothetical protein